MKLIIMDFDGPINDLIEAKRITIKKISRKLKLSFSDEASWALINYIDQIYENKKIYDYKKLIIMSLDKLQKIQLTNLSKKEKVEFANMFFGILNKNQNINISTIESIMSVKNLYPSVKICIYTSQKNKDVIKCLRDQNLNIKLFDKIYGSDYFNESKPSIVNLNRICEEFNTNPKEVVVIGDNVTVDLAPASYLGMKTILLNKFITKTISSTSELVSSLR